MLYAIIGEDIQHSLERRKHARAAHIARIAELVQKGRIVVAGPHPAIDSEDPGEAGFTGSLIVAEFDSLEAARTWADTDPYVEAGVYKQIWVKPFKKVFP